LDGFRDLNPDPKQATIKIKGDIQTKRPREEAGSGEVLIKFTFPKECKKDKESFFFYRVEFGDYKMDADHFFVPYTHTAATVGLSALRAVLRYRGGGLSLKQFITLLNNFLGPNGCNTTTNIFNKLFTKEIAPYGTPIDTVIALNKIDAFLEMYPKYRSWKQVKCKIYSETLGQYSWPLGAILQDNTDADVEQQEVEDLEEEEEELDSPARMGINDMNETAVTSSLVFQTSTRIPEFHLPNSQDAPLYSRLSYPSSPNCISLQPMEPPMSGDKQRSLMYQEGYEQIKQDQPFFPPFHFDQATIYNTQYHQQLQQQLLQQLHQQQQPQPQQQQQQQQQQQKPTLSIEISGQTNSPIPEAVLKHTGGLMTGEYTTLSLDNSSNLDLFDINMDTDLFFLNDQDPIPAAKKQRYAETEDTSVGVEPIMLHSP